MYLPIVVVKTRMLISFHANYHLGMFLLHNERMLDHLPCCPTSLKPVQRTNLHAYTQYIHVKLG